LQIQHSRVSFITTKLVFASIAGVFAAFLLITAGCINQQVTTADCASATGGDFNKSICFQKQAVGVAVLHSGTDTRAQALAKCRLAPDEDVQKVCIKSIASILKDPTLCQEIPDASFVTSFFNIDGSGAVKEGCMKAAQTPTPPCVVPAILILSIGLAAAFIKRSNNQ